MVCVQIARKLRGRFTLAALIYDKIAGTDATPALACTGVSNPSSFARRSPILSSRSSGHMRAATPSVPARETTEEARQRYRSSAWTVRPTSAGAILVVDGGFSAR